MRFGFAVQKRTRVLAGTSLVVVDIENALWKQTILDFTCTVEAVDSGRHGHLQEVAENSEYFKTQFFNSH